jgi:hypothetical protein
MILIDAEADQFAECIPLSLLLFLYISMLYLMQVK